MGVMDNEGHQHDHALHDEIRRRIMAGELEIIEHGYRDDDERYGKIKQYGEPAFVLLTDLMHEIGGIEPNQAKVYSFRMDCGYTGAVVLVVTDQGSCPVPREKTE